MKQTEYDDEAGLGDRFSIHAHLAKRQALAGSMDTRDSMSSRLQCCRPLELRGSLGIERGRCQVCTVSGKDNPELRGNVGIAYYRR